jgi:hypothetical protein
MLWLCCFLAVGQVRPGEGGLIAEEASARAAEQASLSKGMLWRRALEKVQEMCTFLACHSRNRESVRRLGNGPALHPRAPNMFIDKAGRPH